MRVQVLQIEEDGKEKLSAAKCNIFRRTIHLKVFVHILQGMPIILENAVNLSLSLSEMSVKGWREKTSLPN